MPERIPVETVPPAGKHVPRRRQVHLRIRARGPVSVVREGQERAQHQNKDEKMPPPAPPLRPAHALPIRVGRLLGSGVRIMLQCGVSQRTPAFRPGVSASKFVDSLNHKRRRVPRLFEESSVTLSDQGLDSPTPH